MSAAPRAGGLVTAGAKRQQMAPSAVTDGREYEAITGRTDNDTPSISTAGTHVPRPGEPQRNSYYYTR